MAGISQRLVPSAKHATNEYPATSNLSDTDSRNKDGAGLKYKRKKSFAGCCYCYNKKTLFLVSGTLSVFCALFSFFVAFSKPQIPQDLGKERIDYPRIFSLSLDGNKSIRKRKIFRLYKHRRKIDFEIHKPIASKDVGRPDPFTDKQCKKQYEWQLQSFPSCNQFHEIDFHSLLQTKSVSRIGQGYFRDVWEIRLVDNDDILVLKTLRKERPYDERNFDRHRRDALASERLTSSKYIIDIFGSCANSGIFEYGKMGDIQHIMKHYEPDKDLRLTAALHASKALADAHNFDAEGHASLAHTDITAKQFILVNGIFKLNDFNRCRFIFKNYETNEACGYHVSYNPGKNRSPEEYKYELQDEKVDLYSLGNVIYLLLTGERAFHDIDEKSAIKEIVKGTQPSVNEKILNSDIPEDQALLHAMKMCFVYNPKERPSAREVSKYLQSKFNEISRNK